MLKTYTQEELGAAMELAGKLMLNGTAMLERKYRWVTFTPQALARLAHTIGILHGMGASEKLAELLDRIEYLNGYGGRDEETNTRRYKIVLGDDGSFGSFWVRWYREWEPDLTQWDREKSYDDFLRENSVNLELKEWNGSTGSYTQYKYAFTGGLIFHHGSGADDFDGIRNGGWGIHT